MANFQELTAEHFGFISSALLFLLKAVSARNMLQFAPMCYLTVEGDVTLGGASKRLRAEISIQKLNWLQPDHGNPETVL